MTTEDTQLFLNLVDHDFFALVDAAMDDNQVDDQQALQGLIWSVDLDITIH